MIIFSDCILIFVCKVHPIVRYAPVGHFTTFERIRSPFVWKQRKIHRIQYEKWRKVRNSFCVTPHHLSVCWLIFVFFKRFYRLVVYPFQYQIEGKWIVWLCRSVYVIRIHTRCVYVHFFSVSLKVIIET